jgi:hypothetical protein
VHVSFFSFLFSFVVSPCAEVCGVFAMKRHNGFEKWDSIPLRREKSRALSGCDSVLETIVPFYKRGNYTLPHTGRPCTCRISKLTINSQDYRYLQT